MKHLRIFSLACLIGLGLAAQVLSAEDTARKVADLAKAKSGLEMFSGTLLIAEKGEAIYAGASGQADKDLRVRSRYVRRGQVR